MSGDFPGGDFLTCDELQPDYGSFALGVLGEPARSEIADHLARGCPNCARGVSGALTTVAAMYGALQFAMPPKQLRRRVVASVESSPKRPLAGIVIPWAITALMSLALIVLGLSGRHEAADAPRLQQALFMLDDPATRDIPFGQPGKTPSGRIFVNASNGFVLIAQGLPSIPGNKTFQLWVLPANGTPITAGAFDRQPDGTAVVVRTGAITNAAQMEVTVEPSGGSPQPTTSPIFVTNLNK